MPSHADQPKGKRPWCPNCDTDLHLKVESPAVPGRQPDALAVAVRCAECRRSRVLDTTAEHLAALATYLTKRVDTLHHSGDFPHCGEPTPPPASLAAATLRTLPRGGTGPVDMDILDATTVVAGRASRWTVPATPPAPIA